MLKKESSILKEIDMFLTKGNFNEGLKIINKHIVKSNQETIFNIELLLRKCKIHYCNANYTTCLTLANKSLKISSKMKNILLVIDSLQIIGEVYNELGQTNEIYSIIKQIEEQLDVIQENKGIEVQKQRAEYYKLCGLLQVQKSEFNKAITSYQKSIDIFNQLNKKEKIAEVTSRLAYIYFMRGEKENGSIIFTSIDIQKKIGNRGALIRSYIILAETFLRYNEFEQSSLYLDKIFRLLENSENKYLLGHANNLRGMFYYQEGNFSLALEFLNKSLDFFKIIENKSLIASLISNIGLI